jgi:antitoxin MazE
MITKIQKWGNSLALRIPKSVAKTIKIDEGSDVKIKVEKNKIVITRKKNQTYKLKELLSLVTNENLHNENGFKKSHSKEKE